MHWQRVHLQTVGYELAPVVTTTEELEDRLRPVYEKLGIQPGQLEALTGIEERRYWESGTSLTQGAVTAARKVIESSGVPAEQIEAVVYGGVCRELFEPATACSVAAGLEEAGLAVSATALVYDLTNACLGVLNAMVDVANRIELGQIRAGLIVSCESAREIVEVTLDRLLRNPTMSMFSRSLATFTGGSGAAAVLLTDGSFETACGRLLGGAARAAPRYHGLCRWGVERQGSRMAGTSADVWQPFMETDAPAVMEHGLELAEETWRDFLETLGWQIEEIDCTVAHQVGARHRDEVLRRFGVDAARDVRTFDFLGNTGSVAVPLALGLAREQRRLSAGDRVGLLGIGSGLNCLMLGCEWQESP